jgi:hypothetical protein
MVLRSATSLWGALEGVGPENQDFFGPWKWHEQSECHLGPKKSRFSGPTPSNAPSNDVALLKTIKYKRLKNNWYIGSFYVPECCCVLLCTVVVCCCLLLCVRGVGRSPRSCVVWAGIQGVGAGWQGPPSPSHYSVSIHGCLLVGGRGCYSYIRFDPSLAVSSLAHTWMSWRRAVGGGRGVLLVHSEIYYVPILYCRSWLARSTGMYCITLLTSTCVQPSPIGT